jgi:NAD(P)-dependent dehydrogenase (short-subunit alcohol dehydrogenase family)
MMKKACLITGASKGIGAAIAQKFSSQGFFVCLTGRDQKSLAKVQSSLALPNESCTFIVDFLDESQVSSFALSFPSFLKERGLCLISLVNNAGIFCRKPLINENWQQKDWAETWRNQMQVNFFSAVLLTEILIPELKKNAQKFPEQVSIVNVSSTLGFRVMKGVAAYGATKAAMNHWTQSLALELGPEIRANAICPGLVDTPIHSFHFLEGDEKEKALRSMSGLQPLGRIGKPSEVAEAVWNLASPLSSWTTGALIPVDGGINLV